MGKKKKIKELEKRIKNLEAWTHPPQPVICVDEFEALVTRVHVLEHKRSMVSYNVEYTD